MEVALLIPGKAAKNLKIFRQTSGPQEPSQKKHLRRMLKIPNWKSNLLALQEKNFRQFALPYPHHKRQTTNVISAAGYKANTLMMRYYRSRPMLWYDNPSSVNYQRFHSIRKTGQTTAVYQSQQWYSSVQQKYKISRKRYSTDTVTGMKNRLYMVLGFAPV